MNFDARDLMDANMALLEQTVARLEPEPAVVICVATWGRGADPNLLRELQPYRVGLGYNGTVVARVPREDAERLLPPEVVSRIREVEPDKTPICAEVFKDWLVEGW